MNCGKAEGDKAGVRARRGGKEEKEEESRGRGEGGSRMAWIGRSVKKLKRKEDTRKGRKAKSSEAKKKKEKNAFY